MMKNLGKLCILGIVSLLLASSFLTGTSFASFHKKGTSPGSIIDISCSDPYPTMGKPVTIVIIVEGNSRGHRFVETITLTDDFTGFAVTPTGVELVSGHVLVAQFNLTIGRAATYTKMIQWCPSIVGNYTFHCTADNLTEKTRDISVGFDVQNIIYPSLGCPSIISKNTADELPLLVSEERNDSEEPSQILEVELIAADGTAQYAVENQTMKWQTWIKTGSNTLEDDLVSMYNVENIPVGFYNLSVITTKRWYTWPHAVQIIEEEPEEYTVVHLTDIHMKKYSNVIDENKEMAQVIAYINENIHPAFVLISGDAVDWSHKKNQWQSYQDFKETVLLCTSPVFLTPGNHERYGHSLLFLYAPFNNLTAYHRFLSPLSDYSFTYGGVSFVCLDSGYDDSRWEIQPQIWNTTPEGTGLTNTQMYLLEHVWGPSYMNQIITMHHPAVNDRNDTSVGAVPNDLPSGNDECIANNRGAFIQYCVTHNVSLVFSGHTHENHVFTVLGKETTNATAWPLFVQTDSTTLSGQDNGGRVLHIKNGCVESYDYIPFH